ncbi:hypothetical protein M2480_002653, partial [Parabacteroides sp. PFB2-12]|uniref:DUF6443 domain-containing protein n=1 Tax=unclassified Parabacteroides TaxID=2649774 RepID=UPI0024762EE6
MKNNNIFLNSLFIIGFSCLVHFATAQTSTQNYVRTRTMTNSAGTSYLEQVEYYDGLGRPSQVVEAKMGGASQDLVSLIEYDGAGRREKVWLPAVRSGNNSAYVSPSTLRTSSSSSNKGDNKPYSLTVYEPSPLNRVTKEFGPGNDWHTNDRAVHTAYKVNVVEAGPYRCLRHIFFGSLNSIMVSLASDGYYAAGLLYVTETKDEDNNPLYTFTDKEGHVILTRQIS